MSSVTLSAPITAAYISQSVVTLKIYGSDQSLVKTLTQTVLIGGLNTQPGPPPTSSVIATPVTFVWDGTADSGSPSGYPGGGYPGGGSPSSGSPSSGSPSSGSPSSGSPNSGSPNSGSPSSSTTTGGTTTGSGGTSAKADKGVYLYQFQVSSLGGYDDSDQDKSTSLSFGSPATTLAINGSDAAGTTYVLGQTLQDQYNAAPFSNRLDLYENWTLNDVLSEPVSPKLGTTYTSLAVPPLSPARLDAQVSAFLSIFLLSPQDGDAAHDKGHRNRFALQHNQQHRDSTLVTFGGYYPAESATGGWGTGPAARASSVTAADNADKLADTLHYIDFPVRGSNPSPTPDELLYLPCAVGTVNYPHGIVASVADVAVFCGHGPGDDAPGTGFMFGTDKNPTQNDPSLFFLEGDTAADATKWQKSLDEGGDHFSSLDQLRNIWSGTVARTSQVQLVIWAGCNTTSSSTGGGMPANSVAYGGCLCSVGLQTTWYMHDVEVFCGALSNRDMRYEAIKDAVDKAVFSARCGIGKSPKPFYGIAGGGDNRLPF